MQQTVRLNLQIGKTTKAVPSPLLRLKHEIDALVTDLD